MRRNMLQSAVIVVGGLLAAVPALPQYTISARPGAVNYLEGQVQINGKPVAVSLASRMFLGANDSLATTTGKAEVLLTPGVFVRIGPGSELKMISPSLTDTRVELVQGAAVVEVAQLVEGNNIQFLDSGAAVHLVKMGVYQLAAGSNAAVQVFDGKAEVELAGSQISLNKGHELQFSATDKVKTVKFDPKKDTDELYAWSRTRDEYVSASSYDSAKTVATSTFGNSYNSFGTYNSFGAYNSFGGGYGPGWLWNSGFNSYAWLPGEGAFFSPFGYGYFAPGFVGYAPVVYVPVGGGLYGNRPVPVNPTKLPVNLSSTAVGRAAINSAVARQSFARSDWAAAGVRANGGHVSPRAVNSSSAGTSLGASAGSGGGAAPRMSSAPSGMASSSGGHASGSSHK